VNELLFRLVHLLTTTEGPVYVIVPVVVSLYEIERALTERLSAITLPKLLNGNLTPEQRARLSDTNEKIARIVWRKGSMNEDEQATRIRLGASVIKL